MSDADIYTALHEIFAELFLRDDITLEAGTSALDIEGWDSFKQIDIVMAVEARFGITLHTREFDRLRNVGDFVAVIAAKT